MTGINGQRKLLFFFSVILLFFGGCKDSNNDFENLHLDPESLQQTSWKGSLTETFEDNNVEESVIGITFYTQEGNLGIKKKAGVMEDTFTYSVDGKMLIVKQNSYLSGKWFLIEKTKNRMVLERHTGGGYVYKGVLILDRQY
jgi:hypothetical protein